jgi:hypothetical protein
LQPFLALLNGAHGEWRVASVCESDAPSGIIKAVTNGPSRAQKLIMTKTVFPSLFAALLLIGTLDAQTAKQDMKDAGQDVKQSAKSAGNAGKKSGSAAKKSSKNAVHKSAKKVKQGAAKVEDKTK